MSIKELAIKYNQFQNDFGLGIDGDISSLFSPDFRKIVNGGEIVTSSSKLKEQLEGVKEFAGSWKIQEKELIPSLDNQCCTIRYLLTSEKSGTFDIIAIMKSVNGIKIDSIDEVYYQVT